MNKQKQQQNSPQSQDGGYTIIESLVAMIVVSVLMIAIAPVMAFSVGTRVQARRTELATQAARAYIDALRTGALRPTASLPGFPTIRVADNQPVATAAAPGGTAGLYCVNLDDTPDCQTSSSKDFFVQGAWQVPSSVTLTPAGDPTSVGYELMVRVYRADSFAAGVSLKQNPKNEKKQSVVGGLGDRTMPVVEMTTQIPPTTSGGSSAYRSLCSRLQGSSTACN